MNTAAIGTPGSVSATSRIAAATSAASVTSGGTKIARIASQALGVDQRLERPPVVVGRRGRDHVDRVAERRRRGQERGQPRLHVGGQLGHLHPGGLAGVGAQDPGTAGVGDDRDPVAARHRLGGEQRGDVEQLVQRVGADHARLLEQRVDGHVGGGQQRAGVRGGRARARRPSGRS